ncbi:MAG: tyrosine-type recombinase/integrase [Candidatus Tectomicrobia bacterium]|nr:tyrosine-type recombinase/integrase [Candidatus Tectomicrobia bacterium]
MVELQAWPEIDQYLQQLQLKNYALATVKGKGYKLLHFQLWCSELGITKVSEVTREVVAQYSRQVLRKKGKQGRPLELTAYYGYLLTLSLFFRFLLKNGHLLADPTSQLEYPKWSKRLPRTVLTHPQVEEILSLADLSTPFGLRDRAMMETLYSTGVRRMELVGLNVEDVDLENGTLLVREGKGKKDRYVPMGERAIEWLEKYLYEVRPVLVKSQQECTMFLNYLGRPLAAASLTNLIGRYVKARGQSGACHIFRHTMATLMLENGADVRYIQEILGHQQISTTEIYTHVTIQKLKEVYELTHPNHKRQEEAESETTLTTPLRASGGQPSKTEKGELKKSWVCEPSSQGSLKEACQEYLKWMALKLFAPRTIEERSRHLRCFLLWCHERGISGTDSLTQTILVRYQHHMVCLRKCDKPLSSRYRQNHLISIKMFLCYLAGKMGGIFSYLATTLEMPKLPKRIPRYTLSADEAERILSQPDVTNPLGLRDRAILEAIYATGIRRQELINLQVQDIRFEQGTLFVREGKGKKDRIIPLDKQAMSWIEKYLTQVRPLLLKDETQKTLFLGSYGQPLSTRHISQVGSFYIKKADIGKVGSVHLFRHSMATLMLEGGADIRHIQEILGHQCLKTTQIYTQVSIRKLKEVHQKTHPAKSRPHQGTESLQKQRELLPKPDEGK